MASIAHAAHPSQHYLMVRAEVAAQGFDHMAFTIDLLARFAKRIVASIETTHKRWAAARQQAIHDRMFWDLALTDPRVMAELRAIMDHAEAGDAGYKS
jgi:hypothetical protein